MIDTGTEIGAVIGSAVGAVGIVAGALLKVFGGQKKQHDDEILTALIKNQSDHIRILDKLSLLYESQDNRAQERHRSTNHRLDEMANTQIKLQSTVNNIDADMARRKDE